MSSLINVTAPGDLFGAITAVANTITTLLENLRALQQDTSQEAKVLKDALLEFNAPLVALITKLNGKLGIDPLAPHPEPPTKP